MISFSAIRKLCQISSMNSSSVADFSGPKCATKVVSAMIGKRKKKEKKTKNRLFKH